LSLPYPHHENIFLARDRKVIIYVILNFNVAVKGDFGIKDGEEEEDVSIGEMKRNEQESHVLNF
jgi:hypothetical protein